MICRREREGERERNDRPAEDTKYKIQYEERANDDKTDEVDPWPSVAQSVIDLHSLTTALLIQRHKQIGQPSVRRYRQLFNLFTIKW